MIHYRGLNILLVNFVYDDEELLEPYEWQDDDSYEEIENAPLYHVSTKQLHDFLYAKFYQFSGTDGIFIVGDGHYCFVVDIKNHTIIRRGTFSWQQRQQINDILKQEPITFFQFVYYLFFLHHTSAEGNHHMRIFLFVSVKIPKLSIYFIIGVFPYCTGIVHYYIRFFRISRLIANGLQNAGQFFRIPGVHLTAEGFHEKGQRTF